MWRSKRTKRYLKALVAYSKDVYNLVMERIPDDSPVIILNDAHEEELNDDIVNILSDYLVEECSCGNISTYEMIYIAMHIGDMLLNYGRKSKEKCDEEKAFAKLLECSYDEKIAFLINNETVTT